MAQLAEVLAARRNEVQTGALGTPVAPIEPPQSFLQAIKGQPYPGGTGAARPVPVGPAPAPPGTPDLGGAVAPPSEAPCGRSRAP